RIVLQLDAEIVESGFLIIESTAAANVEFSRRLFMWWRRRNIRRSLGRLTAGGFAGTIIDNQYRSHALAPETSRINGECRCSRTVNNPGFTWRHAPGVVQRSRAAVGHVRRERN